MSHTQDTSVGPESTAADRLITKLTDPAAVFTSEQVAYLMGMAQRWGYETRQEEEQAEWATATPVRVTGRWVDQADYRRQYDAAARLARFNDYPGGQPLRADQNQEQAA